MVNHPVLLDNNAMLDERLNYVHNNPVAAGIVAARVWFSWINNGDRKVISIFS